MEGFIGGIILGLINLLIGIEVGRLMRASPPPKTELQAFDDGYDTGRRRAAQLATYEQQKHRIERERLNALYTRLLAMILAQEDNTFRIPRDAWAMAVRTHWIVSEETDGPSGDSILRAVRR